MGIQGNEGNANIYAWVGLNRDEILNEDVSPEFQDAVQRKLEGLYNINDELTRELIFQKMLIFLDFFRKSGSMRKSAEAAGITSSAINNWKKRFPHFNKACVDAYEESLDRLEEEARRRAEDGVEVPVYHQGVQVGSVTKYSDNLLMFLLNGRRSEVFKNRYAAEVSGPGGGAMQIQHNLNMQEIREKMREKLTSKVPIEGEVVKPELPE